MVSLNEDLGWPNNDQPEKSRKLSAPQQWDDTQLVALLVRRDMPTGRFARLRDDDRQLFFPFVGRHN